MDTNYAKCTVLLTTTVTNFTVVIASRILKIEKI